MAGQRLFLVNLWPRHAGVAATVRPVGSGQSVWMPDLAALASYFERQALEAGSRPAANEHDADRRGPCESPERP